MLQLYIIELVLNMYKLFAVEPQSINQSINQLVITIFYS
jgi:hypothetical protein